MERVDIWQPREKAWRRRIKKDAKANAECVREWRARRRAGIFIAKVALYPEQIETLVADGYLTREEALDRKSVEEAFDDFARLALGRSA